MARKIEKKKLLRCETDFVFHFFPFQDSFREAIQIELYAYTKVAKSFHKTKYRKKSIDIFQIDSYF